MKNNLKIFILIVIIQIIMSYNKMKNCNDLLGILIYIFHHIFSVYLYYGWFIFKYNKLHLILSIGVLLSWFLFKKCILTSLTNYLCDFEKSSKFDDILYYLKLTQHNELIHYIIIGSIIFYNVLRIVLKKKLLNISY